MKRLAKADEVVEVPVARTLDECGDLGERVDQCRALRVARVADRDSGTIGQRSHFDAVATGVGAAALLPGEGGGVGDGYPVMSVHVDLSGGREADENNFRIAYPVHVHQLLRLHRMESRITHVRM